MKTFKQNPITVLGDVKKVGDIAPNFKALSQGLEEMSLSDYKSKYIVLNVVPSLDTSVCSMQTRRVNQDLVSREDVTVLTISNDLPFAQSRWCGNAGLDNVITLSDHRELDFANKYGTNIKELRLQARSVFVLDEKRKILYLEYLDEMTEHLNYDKLTEFVKALPKE
ncbi:MAG: thiol peroxidase [Acholeplasmataceae bacterium]|jgi:thiol peroxidase|nr:thiol peroxidase [Acholeplasmataceae bacterium]